MENPFYGTNTAADVVRGKLEGKKIGDFIVFNYKDLKLNHFNLRTAIQYVCKRYLNGLNVKTKHNVDKTELWVTIVYKPFTY